METFRNTYDKNVNFRATSAELFTLHQAAQKADLSLSDFIRATALSGARVVLTGNPKEVDRFVRSTGIMLMSAIEGGGID